MFAVLQNKRLNQHLAYTILDEVRYFFFVKQLAITQQHHLFSVDCGVISGGVYMTMTSATSATAISLQVSYDVYCRLRSVIMEPQSMTDEYDERYHSNGSETSHLHTGLHDVCFLIGKPG
jgi:hypothetical protein